MGLARTRDRTGASFARDEDQTADVIDLELCKLDVHAANEPGTTRYPASRSWYSSIAAIDWKVIVASGASP